MELVHLHSSCHTGVSLVGHMQQLVGGDEQLGGEDRLVVPNLVHLLAVDLAITDHLDGGKLLHILGRFIHEHIAVDLGHITR